MGFDLGPRMLPAAEPDFQPQFCWPIGEGRHRVGRPRRLQTQPGQGDVQQQLLTRPERVAARPAIQALRRGLELKRRGGLHIVQCYRPNALFSAGTRSVFSQVNVPSSGSGSRPKWPYALVTA